MPTMEEMKAIGKSLEDLRKTKRAYELTITQLLNKFMELTGVKIEDVKIRTEQFSNNVVQVLSVEIKVEL